MCSSKFEVIILYISSVGLCFLVSYKMLFLWVAKYCQRDNAIRGNKLNTYSGYLLLSTYSVVLRV